MKPCGNILIVILTLSKDKDILINSKPSIYKLSIKFSSLGMIFRSHISSIFLISISIFSTLNVACQSDEDAFFIKDIYDYTLAESKAYEWLTVLSTEYGGRLSASDAAERSVNYTQSIMESMEMDKVWLQECTVPNWTRGEKELVVIIDSKSKGTVFLESTSLGNSIGSGPNGVFAQVIEVKGLDELRAIPDKDVKGKIVFFNRPMDPTQLRTFNAYGGAVDQRGRGPAIAGSKGAVAAIVRSMTTLIDDVPHTGVTIFNDGETHIPAMAISTKKAELLSDLLKKETVEIYLENHSSIGPDKTSYNVIGEIRGSKYPDEIILVGGHLDSWDLGGGAHDDGAGCIHSLQVIETLKALKYTPNRTIRCVMFMNEENGLGGAKAYAAASNENNEYHMAAIESDAGGFSPRGIGVGGETAVFESKFSKIRPWRDLFGSYGVDLTPGGGGADINPLKSQGGLLFGLRPDSQRYFDYHHTKNDNIEAVNQRELELGAAAMTSLVYLLDKYGTEEDK
jgi:hypothetical protein